MAGEKVLAGGFDRLVVFVFVRERRFEGFFELEFEDFFVVDASYVVHDVLDGAANGPVGVHFAKQESVGEEHLDFGEKQPMLVEIFESDLGIQGNVVEFGLVLVKSVEFFEFALTKAAAVLREVSSDVVGDGKFAAEGDVTATAFELDFV